MTEFQKEIEGVGPAYPPGVVAAVFRPFRNPKTDYPEDPVPSETLTSLLLAGPGSSEVETLSQEFRKRLGGLQSADYYEGLLTGMHIAMNVMIPVATLPVIGSPCIAALLAHLIPVAEIVMRDRKGQEGGDPDGE